MSTPRERLSALGEGPVASLEGLDMAMVPRAPDRYQQDPIAVLATPVPADVAVFDNSHRLDTLLDKALNKLEGLLDEPFDFSEPRIVNAQLAAAQSVVTAVLKADDTRLRARQTDMLPKLLEVIAREKLKLPRIIDAV